MMRPITCLSLLVALGAGLYLYQVKHRAQLLDRDINRTVKLAETARDRVGLLKAEWALLEDPQRLQDLVTHHLQLQPLQPAQFVRLEDLSSRLPPVPVPAAEPATVAATTPEPDYAPVKLAQAAAPIPAASLPVPPAPIAPAHAAPPKPRPTTLASLAKPRPLYAPAVPAYQPSPVVVHVPTVQTASATAPIAAPASPYVGSALGMARTGRIPPVPVPGPGYGYATQQ